MARVLPSEITASDVAAMLAALDEATPHLGVPGRAYVELADPKTSPFPVVFVALRGEGYALSARRAVGRAIAALPYLHAWVVELYGRIDPDDPQDAADEHALSHLEIDAAEVYLGYVPSYYNSQWGHSFRRDRAGRWRHRGADAAVVETPSTQFPRPSEPWEAACQGERRARAEVYRCVLGGPFRSAALAVSWRTQTVVAMARGMDESRDFAAMPILADALQDAGCDDEQILDHCRSPGLHVRGCWVLDLLLSDASARAEPGAEPDPAV